MKRWNSSNGESHGIRVVQVENEADGDLVVLEVIEERTAAGLHIERPAEGMLDQAGLVVLRLDLPELLEADAVFAGLAAIGKIVFRDQLLGERTARALADQHIFAEQRHARRKARTVACRRAARPCRR